MVFYIGKKKSFWQPKKEGTGQICVRLNGYTVKFYHMLIVQNIINIIEYKIFSYGEVFNQYKLAAIKSFPCWLLYVFNCQSLMSAHTVDNFKKYPTTYRFQTDLDHFSLLRKEHKAKVKFEAQTNSILLQVTRMRCADS